MNWLTKIFSGMGTKMIGILSAVVTLFYIYILRKDKEELKKKSKRLEESLRFEERRKEVEDVVEGRRQEREKLNNLKDDELKKLEKEVMNENTNVVDIAKLRRLLDPDLKDE